MAQPYNYMLPQVNPLESVTSGLQLGATLGQLAQQKEEADLLKAKRKRAALFQTDMASFLTDPTPRKSIDLIKKYPEYVEKIQAGRKAGEEAEDRAEFDLIKNMFVAANNGDIDYAKGLMQKHIDVLKAEGKDASEFEPILNAFDSGNANKVIGYLSSQAAALYPDEWIKTSEAMEKSKQEQAKTQEGQAKAEQERAKAQYALKQQAAELGLTNAQIAQAAAKTKNLDQNTENAVFNLQAIQSGKVDPKEKFNQENTIRTQYQSRAKNYDAVRDAFSTIETSAQDKTGAGDIALVTSFMKMLDPGSVVRETEFATARDTGGLLDKLQGQAEKIKKGSFLSESQRKSFAGLAKKYLEAADKREGQIRNQYENIVDTYSLDYQNVFGRPKETKSGAWRIVNRRTAP